MHLAYRWLAEIWRGYTVNTGIAIRICMSLFIVFSFTEVKAQTVSRSVLSATGGTGLVAGKTAEWSVGGTAATSTVVLPNGQVLTQGFLQPADIVIQLLLTFDPLGGKTYEDVDFVLNGIASDGSGIDYESSDQTVAQIINGNTVKIVGAGSANIKATIRGTTISKDQPLVVDKASQVITFDLIPVLYKGDAAYSMNALSNKGLPVTYTNSNPFVVNINGNAITPVDLSKATVTAAAAGNANYKQAASVAQLVEVISRTGEQISVPLVITPNGDGINDVLVIKGIENYPDNRLVIVNRNGVKIFEVKNYDNSQIIFSGNASYNGVFDGKIIGGYVPQGTYFYSLSYKDGNTTKVKTGWFVIKY